ncbi:FecR domain-containing protein [Porticoccus sp. W117]|uniref:FecR family protein n=1 Tax=Porticoccus sp. W117 TaxID=3054777 RepID=UPI0025961F64|nr:FecR domain-containing protein [Porticoccus sp. W117]MDM3871198.1 FecR domain-containing protein [Porticoccus sp. W117]
MKDKMKREFSEQKAASDWLDMLSGELSEESVQRITRAKEDPEYNQLFEQLAEADDCMESALEDTEFVAKLEHSLDLSAQPQSKQSGNKRKSLLSWSLVASVLLVATAVVWNSGPIDSQKVDAKRYVTRIGEQRQVDLADGTQVTMNTGTQLQVEFSTDRRLIRLDRGEAFFDVASDPKTPFVVSLGGREVTVLGTAFNIHRTGDGFFLAVTEGKVAVHREHDEPSFNRQSVNLPVGAEQSMNANKQWLFTAGLVAYYKTDTNTIVASRPKNVEHLIGWTTGVLRFEDIDFHEVILALNRYSAKKILVKDASLLDEKVNAAVVVSDVSDALNILSYALPIEVVHDFNQIIIHRSEGK